MLNDHLDTYPAVEAERWDKCDGDPFKATRRGDWLYGRGTSDTQGNLAASLLAVQALTEEGVKLNGDLDAAWFWEPNLNKTVKNGGHIFMTSGVMASRGYPTWDVGVVMNEFAKKHSEYVKKFLKAECAGIDFWLKNPGKTAKIIAKELELSLTDATRMMKGTEMVPCKEQLTAKYMGSSRRKGQFVVTLVSPAKFLVEQERLPKLLPRSRFSDFIKPHYLEEVMK